MGYYELSVYLLCEDGDCEMQHQLMKDTLDRCLNYMHKIKGSLKDYEYFEIYQDELQETRYFLSDGTEVKNYKALVAALR